MHNPDETLPPIAPSTIPCPPPDFVMGVDMGFDEDTSVAVTMQRTDSGRFQVLSLEELHSDALDDE